MNPDDIDLVDLDRFAQGFPHDVFTFLRRERPVWFHPGNERAPGGEGFWVISRHGDILAVLNDYQRFSSETGPREGGGTTLEDFPRSMGPGTMLNMTDPPRHRRIRLLVNKAFKPSTLARLENQLRDRTRQIFDEVDAKGGDCDFVHDVAAELPLQLISGMLGLPLEDRHRLFQWTMTLVDYADRNLGERSDALIEAAGNLDAYGRRLIAEKQRQPGEDMMSIVANAEVPADGGGVEKLGFDEIMQFFHLLIVAGAETTRNGIAHGLLALLQHPDQLQRLRREPGLMAGATEEILRWTSPTAYNRRTATEDVEFAGQRIRAGDKVTVWYPSGNRDESVFDEPFRFDVSRRENPQMAFGHGVHHCLGAGLARMEIRLMFEELLPRFPHIEQIGEVEWARSNKHNGMRHLPVRLSRLC